MFVNATVNYHVVKDVPQAFEFDVDGIMGNLVSPDLVTTDVTVLDLRDETKLPNFNDDGIVFVHSASEISNFSDNNNWQDTYNDELVKLLEKQIDAKDVIVFDHTVRIDDPNAERRPARNVHNDFNREGAEQRLIDIVGEDLAQEYHKAGFGFVNIWRPVEQLILSSPLGFIWPRSMRPSDWMDIDLIYHDRKGQILGVAPNKDHEWFYKSEMTPEEAIIFNIYDSQSRPHLAHSALDLPTDAQTKYPRKSIESRTLVRYS